MANATGARDEIAVQPVSHTRMREHVSSRQRFRSNCPVNAALRDRCSFHSFTLSVSLPSDRPFRSNRIRLPPALFVPPTWYLHSWLVLLAGSRPGRDRSEQSRRPSSTPPSRSLAVLSPSLPPPHPPALTPHLSSFSLPPRALFVAPRRRAETR